MNRTPGNGAIMAVHDTTDTYGRRIDEHTVQFVRVLPGPIERIWEYLWDGKKRGEWFAAGAMPTTPGESFTMYLKHSDLSPNKAAPPPALAELDRTGHQSHNVLLVYEPPRRLVFKFGPGAHTAEDATVEFLLSPEGDPSDNTVRLTLTHRDIPDRKYAVDVSGGWHSYLSILQDKAEGRTPPAFWDVWRQIDGVYETRYQR
jgi:uncharacterized protein YndB with AHSA1/START domain